METREVIRSFDACLREFGRFLYDHPEPGFREFAAVKAFQDFLTARGFDFRNNYCDMPTAFRAEYGSGCPRVAILAEYDALNDLGHACGHHLISTAALAAFLAASQLREQCNIPGSIVLIGAPAEETLGGKIDLLKRGGYDGIDCALISHPYKCSALDNGAMAVRRYDVSFLGRAAHAATAPFEGVNALDAMMLLFHAVDCHRQQMPRDAMIHGIITNGGELPNVIPDRTAAFFYLRGLSDTTVQLLEKRFRAMVKGAASMTGCRGRCRERKNAYAATRLNPALSAAIGDAMTKLGMPPVALDEHISTDFADVSKFIPGANFFFQALSDPAPGALHSREFLQKTALPFAFDRALDAGAIMAEVALKFLRDPDFRREVVSAPSEAIAKNR